MELGKDFLQTEKFEPNSILDYTLTLGEKVGDLKGKNKQHLGIIIDIKTKEDKTKEEKNKQTENEVQEMADNVHKNAKEMFGEENVAPALKMNLISFKTERYLQVMAIKHNNLTLVSFGKLKKLSEKDFQDLVIKFKNKFDLGDTKCH